MPGKNQRPRRLVPDGLVDAAEGSEAIRGAMWSLQNLIPQPQSRGIHVPRPAWVELAGIPDYSSGPPTMISVGNKVYGIAGSASFTGKDRPFVYDAVANSFLNISGLATGNLPTSPPATGEWTPPTIAQIGGRIVYTHPGFPGGTSNAPFYAAFTANVYNGQTQIDGWFPVASTIPAGAGIMGAGIPSLTTVVSTGSITIMVTASTVNENPVSFNVSSPTGLVRGLQCQTSDGTLLGYILAIAGSLVTLNSDVVPAGFTGGLVTFTGNTLVMSRTGTANDPATPIVVIGPGIGAIKFGWLDISGFTTTTTATLVNGSPVIAVGSILGLQPGYTVSGTGIPADTTIIGIGSSDIFLVPGTTQSNSITITVPYGPGQPAPAPLAGQTVTGPGIPTNTVISSMPTLLSVSDNSVAWSVPLSQAVTSGISGTYTLSGAEPVTLSANATAGGSQSLTFTGGTPAAPLWGAGDMAIHPLGGVPVFVSQFNGRAWFGVNTGMTAGVQASDAGSACVQTNANQTLSFQDVVPVTAAAGLGLYTQLGGIIQSLLVFQSDTNIRQITGDFASGNLTVNPLQTATGTLSPISMASTPKGLLFIATDGARLIDFNAQVSDPLGRAGKGISLPFVNATVYSRIVAAFNENIYRVTVTWQPPQSASMQWGTLPRTDEFWLHLDRDRWSGPHTSTLDAAVPFPHGSSFIVAPQGARGILARSDPNPSRSSNYFENGQPLQIEYGTALLPDNPEQMAVAMSETTVFCGLRSGSGTLLATATDDVGVVQGQAYIWIGPFSTPAQRPIPWHQNLVYRQVRISIAGQADASLQLGALSLRDEILGYQLPYPIPAEFVVGTSVLGGPDALGP